jgi:hypothetical protein
MSTHSAADVVSRMLLAIDEVDWPGVRSAFADRVRVDYESLSGAAPAEVEADALIESWRELVPGFDATQHHTGPIVVDETGPDEARARTSVRGYHWIAGEEWMVAGRYDIVLRRMASAWRIASMTLTVSRQTGVLSLPETARERARSNPRMRSTS